MIRPKTQYNSGCHRKHCVTKVDETTSEGGGVSLAFFVGLEFEKYIDEVALFLLLEVPDGIARFSSNNPGSSAFVYPVLLTTSKI